MENQDKFCPFKYAPHDTDCSKYLSCKPLYLESQDTYKNGLITIGKCKEGYLFHPEEKRCIIANKVKCKPSNNNRYMSMNIACTDSVFLHTDCSKWYTCDSMPSDLSQGIVKLHQCDHHHLFDTEEGYCLFKDYVICGSRIFNE